MNEFIHLITEAELLLRANWRHAGKHKPRFLSLHSKGFVDELMSLSSLTLATDGKAKASDIAAYIDYYVSRAKLKHNSIPNDRFVVDLAYADYTTEHFIKECLPLIRQDIVLGLSFLYFYSTPPQPARLYKNRVCLVFKIIGGQKNETVFAPLSHCSLRGLDLR